VKRTSARPNPAERAGADSDECFWPMLFENGEGQTLETTGESGNGAEGDLKSICFSSGG
jgi:hypothetical protein